MDCPTHETHEIKCPTNKNNFTVILLSEIRPYMEEEKKDNNSIWYHFQMKVLQRSQEKEAIPQIQVILNWWTLVWILGIPVLVENNKWLIG